MAKIVAGLFLGVFIGAGCRWFDIPLPSPPKLVGVLLIASITGGYVATDKIMLKVGSSTISASTKALCGGPTGDTVSGPLAFRESLRSRQRSRNESSRTGANSS
jgi:XapX domain-containing protein